MTDTITATSGSHSEVEAGHPPTATGLTNEKVGMWAFLGTAVLMFGAIFVSYGVYRSLYSREFLHGSLDLKWYLGGFNTAVLLMSSFFMAMAVHSAARTRRARQG